MIVGSAPRRVAERAVTTASWVTVLAGMLATHTALTALRLFFPGVYGLSERSGTARTALVVVAVVAVLALVPLLRRACGAGLALGGALAVLGVWRVAVQLWPSVPLALAAVGVVVAAVTLTLVLTSAATPRTKATGLFGGLLLDVVVMCTFATWDPAWQHRRPGPVLVAMAVTFGLVLLARPMSANGRHRNGPSLTFGGGVALGGVLGLELLFLANPAFVTASGHVTLAWGTLLTLVAVSLAVATHHLDARPNAVAVGIAAGVLTLAAVMLPVAHGAMAVVWVLAAQVCVGVVTARALAPTTGRAPARGELGLAVGWVFPILVTLLYQLHYDRALPMSNRVLTALASAATLLALVAHRPARTKRRSERTISLSSVGLTGVLLTGVLGVTAPERAATPPTTRAALRVVQWNVHQAVSDDGQLDPLAVAQAIEAQQPVDVVVLNEVGRGWPLSGQLDLASWLSRRLDLPFVWGGAASDEFGNVVLSRLPVVASTVVTLPSMAGAQGRSVVDLTLDRGAGAAVHVLATHLQHRNDERAVQVRMDEIALLVARTGTAPTILAGDLNPKQGDPPAYPVRRPDQFAEIAALTAAGYTTAADLTACATPSSNRNCSDYVLVHGAAIEQRLAVVPTTFSDHRILVADVLFS